MKQLNLLKTLFLLCALVVGSLNSWGTIETYKLTIQTSDFNTTSYAANNNEKTTNAICTTDNTKAYEVKWTSNQVMQQSSVMQWQKNYGYIYNSTSLGTITDVTITSTAGTFTTYYGEESQPSTSTTVGGSYFKINVGNATGKSSKIVVTFNIEAGVEKTPVATIGDLGLTTLNFGAEGTFAPTITPATGLTASDYTVAWDEVDNAQLTLLEDGTYEAGTTTGSVEVKVTVTPSAAKAEEYKAVSKTFNITVINPNVNDGSLAKPFTVAEVNDGTASGSSVYVKGIIVGVFKGKDADAETTAPFEKTNFALSDSRNEISGSKTIAVQLPTGTIRTAWNLDDNNVLGMEVLVKGSVEAYFAGKTGVKSPTEIIAVSVPATITCEGGVASFASTYALDLTNLPEGVEAYKATEAGSNKVSLEKVEVAVPKGTGLILKGTKDEIYAIPVAESASALAGNLLVGVIDAGGADVTANSAYGLAKADGKFHKIGADITIPAGKAYLPASSLSANELELDFGESGDVTGINEIAAGKAFNGEFFNLAGQRVAQPTKGLYIVNGKKVIIK